VPIHIRAEPGDYAEACLVPGDPLRATHIAESFLEGAVQANAERGLVGYTGTFHGVRVSVQASGMGCPSAAIVYEELIQLGVKRLLRVGTCGGLQPDLSLGDLIVAVAATPADQTTLTYTGGEPHAPTASWELVHGAVHAAKELGTRVRVGSVVSSDVFYDPDPGRAGHDLAEVASYREQDLDLAAPGQIEHLGCGRRHVVAHLEAVQVGEPARRAGIERQTGEHCGIRPHLGASLDS